MNEERVTKEKDIIEKQGSSQNLTKALKTEKLLTFKTLPLYSALTATLPISLATNPPQT